MLQSTAISTSLALPVLAPGVDGKGALAESSDRHSTFTI